MATSRMELDKVDDSLSKAVLRVMIEEAQAEHPCISSGWDGYGKNEWTAGARSSV